MKTSLLYPRSTTWLILVLLVQTPSAAGTVGPISNLPYGLSMEVSNLFYGGGKWSSDAMQTLKQMGPTASPAAPYVLRFIRFGNTDLEPRTRGRTKRNAAETLAAMGLGAIPALEKALNEDHPLVRIVACEALMKLGPIASSAVPSLRKIVQNESDPVLIFKAVQAIEAIGKTSDAEVEALVGLIQIPRLDLTFKREEIFKTLGKMGKKALSSKDALKYMYSKATHSVEQKEILLALGKFGQPGLAILISGLKDYSWTLQNQHAITALIDGGIETAELLSKEIESQGLNGWCKQVLVALGKDAAPLVPWLIDRLSENPDQARPLIDILADIGPAAMPAVPLLKAIFEKGGRDSIRAAIALAHIQKQETDVPLKVFSDAIREEFNVAEILNALSDLGPKASPLSKQLADILNSHSYDSGAKRAACHALASLGSKATDHIPDLERLLLSSYQHANDAALEALGSLGSDAIPSLIKAMAHKNLREKASKQISLLGPEAVPYVVKAWTTEKSSEIRGALSKALIASGSNIVKPVIALADHSNIYVRMNTLNVLREFSGQEPEILSLILKMTKDENETVRSNAYAGLREFQPLLDKPYVRKRLKKIEEVLLQGIKGTKWHHRGNAISSLQKLDLINAKNLPLVMNALDDSQVEVVQVAVYGIGRANVHSKKLLMKLRELISNHPVEMVRAQAAYALRASAPNEAATTETLIDLLGDSSEVVRNTASSSLGLMAPVSIPALLKALQSSDKAIRDLAAEALGLAGKTAIPGLTKALADDRYDVREAALNACSQIHESSHDLISSILRLLADDDNNTRRLAEKALAFHSFDSIPILLLGLKSDIVDIRHSSSTILGKLEMRLEKVEQALNASLEDSDHLVRRQAALSLVALGFEVQNADTSRSQADNNEFTAYSLAVLARAKNISSSEIPEVLRALESKDANTRFIAMAALSHGHKLPEIMEAAPRIARALGDPDGAVRAQSAEGLFRIYYQNKSEVMKIVKKNRPNTNRGRAYQAYINRNPGPESRLYFRDFVRAHEQANLLIERDYARDPIRRLIVSQKVPYDELLYWIGRKANEVSGLCTSGIRRLASGTPPPGLATDLLKIAAQEDHSARILALDLLPKMGLPDHDVLEIYRPIMEKGTPKLQERVINQITEMKDRARPLIPTLENCVTSCKGQTRAKAIFLLARFGTQSPILLKHCKKLILGGDVNPAIQGVRALGFMTNHSKKAISIILDAAAMDGKKVSWITKQYMPSALANLVGPHDKRAVPFLTSYVRYVETSDKYHIYALRALSKIGPNAASAIPVIKNLLSLDRKSKTQIEALKALGQIGDASLEILEELEKWSMSGAPLQVRAAAIESMGYLQASNEMLSKLLSALSLDDPSLRIAACKGLGRAARSLTGVAEALLSNLEDRHSGVRAAALEGLLQSPISDQKIEDKIVDYLLKNRRVLSSYLDDQIKGNKYPSFDLSWFWAHTSLIEPTLSALQELGRLGISAMAKDLEKLDPNLQERILVILINSGETPDYVLPKLTALVKEAPENVAYRAIFAAELFGPKAIHAILEAFEHESERIQKHALWIIDTKGDQLVSSLKSASRSSDKLLSSRAKKALARIQSQ